MLKKAIVSHLNLSIVEVTTRMASDPKMDESVQLETRHLELGDKDVVHSVAPQGTHDQDAEFGVKDQRRIIRKIDLRLTGVLGLLFAACIMDRNNIGNAKIAG